MLTLVNNLVQAGLPIFVPIATSSSQRRDLRLLYDLVLESVQRNDTTCLCSNFNLVLSLIKRQEWFEDLNTQFADQFEGLTVFEYIRRHGQIFYPVLEKWVYSDDASEFYIRLRNGSETAPECQSFRIQWLLYMKQVAKAKGTTE